MKTYRLKHLPSGLYFCPSRDMKVFLHKDDAPTKETVYVKSNLSAKGKIYPKKPTVKWLGDVYYNHLIPVTKDDLYLRPGLNKGCICQTIEAEWQIEEC